MRALATFHEEARPEVVLSLISEVRASRAGGWVACSERMPAEHEIVMFVAFGQMCVGNYRPGDNDANPWSDLLVVDMCGDCDHYSSDQVTHWMPLPSPPRSEP